MPSRVPHPLACLYTLYWGQITKRTRFSGRSQSADTNTANFISDRLLSLENGSKASAANLRSAVSSTLNSVSWFAPPLNEVKSRSVICTPSLHIDLLKKNAYKRDSQPTHFRSGSTSLAFLLQFLSSLFDTMDRWWTVRCNREFS